MFGHVGGEISFVPILIFVLLMPETLGDREHNHHADCSVTGEASDKKESKTPRKQETNKARKRIRKKVSKKKRASTLISDSECKNSLL